MSWDDASDALTRLAERHVPVVPGDSLTDADRFRRESEDAWLREQRALASIDFSLPSVRLPTETLSGRWVVGKNVVLAVMLIAQLVIAAWLSW